MNDGRVAGVETLVSRLVQGTVMIQEDDIVGSFALLDAVFAQGGTTFDTARHYGGDSEVVFGRWLRERGPGHRDQVVIIGKGAHHTAEGRRVTPTAIGQDLDESLVRLGVATIDLYLLHRDDPTVPVGPLVEALHTHRRAGKIRAYGGSNWSIARITEANAYAADHGLTPFAASSPQFSLVEQAEPPWDECVSISGPGETAVAARAWYAANRMPLFCWSSLAGGFLSGRYTRDNIATLPGEAAARTRRVYGTAANFDRLDRASQLATERGLSVTQIALAWVLHQPLDIYPLVGCESGEEFAANAAALDVRLSAAEMEWLDLRRDGR